MEENRKDRRKTGLLLSILGVISLVLITAGVTYAFFSYAKEGQTENVITTGTIRFAYNEVEANGKGIKIEDALPITDEAGKALSDATESGQSFHFTVTSVTPSTAKIPYVVTVKKTDTSTIATDQVKLYLVATGSQTGNGTTVGTGDVVNTFSLLPGVSTNSITADLDDANERILFTGEVPASASNYSTEFTLRMWLSGDASSNATADYSPYEFVKVASVTGNTAFSAEDAIRAGNFITSTAYYALPATATAAKCIVNDVDTIATNTTEDACTAANGTWTAAQPVGRDEYERIAYVNTTDKTILTRTQAINLGYASVDGDGNFIYSSTTGTVEGFNQTEQYYQINGQTFTATVNVYAQGAKVTN